MLETLVCMIVGPVQFLVNLLALYRWTSLSALVVTVTLLEVVLAFKSR